MIQEPKGLPAPIGVVYNTSMARPDAALALAALYVEASRRQARVDGICVTGSGLDAAIFCDIVGRFYTGQTRTPSSNAVLPIGFAADTPPPPNPPMVATAIKRMRADGQLQYVRGIQRVTDTGLPDALLRNAITFSVETVVVLSAPATWLAKAVGLAGAAAQYRQRVKRVVIVETSDLERDPPAAKALLGALPLPPVLAGAELRRALAVSRARIEEGFAWTSANPVADAVVAGGGAEVPLLDVAALHFALHPDSGLFTVTGGRLTLNPSKKDECVDELVALATSKPAPAPPRGG
jgi:hypothetical protein